MSVDLFHAIIGCVFIGVWLLVGQILCDGSEDRAPHRTPEQQTAQVIR
jgi:hypothetical protein